MIQSEKPKHSENLAQNNYIILSTFSDLEVSSGISFNLNANDISPLMRKRHLDLSQNMNAELKLESKQTIVKTNEYDKMRMKYQNFMTKFKKHYVDSVVSIQLLGKN